MEVSEKIRGLMDNYGVAMFNLGRQKAQSRGHRPTAAKDKARRTIVHYQEIANDAKVKLFNAIKEIQL